MTTDHKILIKAAIKALKELIKMNPNMSVAEGTLGVRLLVYEGKSRESNCAYITYIPNTMDPDKVGSIMISDFKHHTFSVETEEQK